MRTSSHETRLALSEPVGPARHRMAIEAWNWPLAHVRGPRDRQTIPELCIGRKSRE